MGLVAAPGVGITARAVASEDLQYGQAVDLYRPSPAFTMVTVTMARVACVHGYLAAGFTTGRRGAVAPIVGGELRLRGSWISSDARSGLRGRWLTLDLAACFFTGA